MSVLITLKSTSGKREGHNSENNQMELVNSKQNIPAPEPDSIPDSSSPDSSSPEADSIPDKSGKIKLRIVINGYGAYLFLEIWFFEGFLRVPITTKSSSGKQQHHKIRKEHPGVSKVLSWRLLLPLSEVNFTRF